MITSDRFIHARRTLLVALKLPLTGLPAQPVGRSARESIMRSKELVQSSIHFKNPERLAFDMFVSGPSDVYHVNMPNVRSSGSSSKVVTDRFGCHFRAANENTMGQPTDFPLADIRCLPECKFPNPHDNALYEDMNRRLADAGDHYVCSYILWFTLFERMHFMHGFENTLVDLYVERSLMLEFADKILNYNLEVVREIGNRFPGRIHGMALSDDWGTQTSTLVSLQLFREFFLPRYKQLFIAIQAHGMDVWLHSCGYVLDFIPSFLESGVSVLNFQQPKIYHLSDLKRFAGSVSYSVPIDIQNTMPTASSECIRHEAKELIQHLATPHGGFIASEHPDYAGNGISPMKGKWAYTAFKDADPYKYRILA